MRPFVPLESRFNPSSVAYDRVSDTGILRILPVLDCVTPTQGGVALG